jgi:outer membrane protein insertion porin family
LQLRYSIYQQKVELPQILRNCNNISPDFLPGGTFPTPAAFANGTQFHSAAEYLALYQAAGSPAQVLCTQDGEASLAVRRELAQGPVLTSLVGYDLSHNTLDNNRNPTSGMIAILKQDFAGVGGDVQFIRTTGDLRTYYEVMQDVVGVLHLQAGHIAGWGSQGLRMPVGLWLLELLAKPRHEPFVEDDFLEKADGRLHGGNDVIKQLAHVFILYPMRISATG